MPDFANVQANRMRENFDRRFDAVIVVNGETIANPWYSPVQIAFSANSKSRFGRWADYQASVVRQATQVLNTEGIPTMMYAAYLGYANEMARKCWQGVTGTSLQLEALVLLNKWVARGLTQSVLEAIRLMVFNVSAPADPPPPPPAP